MKVSYVGDSFIKKNYKHINKENEIKVRKSKTLMKGIQTNYLNSRVRTNPLVDIGISLYEG